MADKRDWTGVVQGRLTVLRPAGTDRRGALWACKCACGVECVKSSMQLARGRKSCSVACGSRRHMGSYTKEYRAWVGAKRRCLVVHRPDYPRYGGSGVTMHPEWVESFAAFRAYIGPAPDEAMTLDRIDNDKGYEPGNVRWATKQEQAVNRRNTIFVVLHGERLTLDEIAQRHDLPYQTIYKRYTYGFTGEKLTMPSKRKIKTGYKSAVPDVGSVIHIEQARM